MYSAHTRALLLASALNQKWTSFTPARGVTRPALARKWGGRQGGGWQEAGRKREEAESKPRDSGEKQGRGGRKQGGSREGFTPRDSLLEQKPSKTI